jgi:hypothetical protein
MDRVFNKKENKKEYLFDNKESKDIIQFLINAKFIWVKGQSMFYLRDKYKSTQIEIHIQACCILIYNDKEISKIVLTRDEYLSLVLGIQETVTNE